MRKDGTKVEIVIGEKEDDPVLVITDLLVHLSREQLDKPARTVIEGEKLDLLIANKPLEGEEKDAVKAGVLKLLKRTITSKKKISSQQSLRSFRLERQENVELTEV